MFYLLHSLSTIYSSGPMFTFSLPCSTSALLSCEYLNCIEKLTSKVRKVYLTHTEYYVLNWIWKCTQVNGKVCNCTTKL